MGAVRRAHHEGEHNRTRESVYFKAAAVSSQLGPHGFVHAHPPHHHWSHLPSLRQPQGGPIRLSGVLWSLAQVLGGARGVQPGGAAARPCHQPPALPTSSSSAPSWPGAWPPWTGTAVMSSSTISC